MTARKDDHNRDDLEGPSDARDLLLLCSEYGHVAGVLSQASDRQDAQAARQVGKVCGMIAERLARAEGIRLRRGGPVDHRHDHRGHESARWPECARDRRRGRAAIEQLASEEAASR